MTRVSAAATLAVSLLILAFGVPALISAPAASSQARILVGFRAGVSSAAANAALARAGAKSQRTIAGIGVRVAQVPANAASSALGHLRANPSVRFAELDRVLQPQEQLPNDPYFLNSGSWNISGGAWGWYQTHTVQAWDITRGDPSVVVAVLDTGLKTQGLADFNGQVVGGWNVLNGTSDTSSGAGNHGTYVAGVVGLALGNGTGNSGVCPGCRVMPVQIGTDSGAYLADMATGITWAADHGARVENLSWAGTSSSSALASAVSYARSKGVVVVAAAGNTNCNCPNYPAATPGVIGVAGTDSAGNKAGDSNYGSWVTVAAPEGNLTSWPTVNGQPGYAAFGGTSSASPFVAAIAGLLFSYQPSLSGAQVEQTLEQTAAPVPFTVQYGRVDALDALQSLGASDPQPSSPPVQVAAPQIYSELNGLTSIAPLAGAPQIGQVLVRGVGGWTGSAGLTVTGLQWQRCDSNGASCAYLTNLSTYTVQTADTGYAFKLSFTVKNSLGSVPVSVLTAPVGGSSSTVTAPANTSLPTISGTPQAGQALTSSTGSWSGSPTGYTFQWQRCDATGAGCAAISGATSSSYSAQTADVGSTLRAAVTASNGAGSVMAVSAQTAVVGSAPTPPPPPATTQTLTFSGSLNTKNPSRSFSVAVGAGVASARLSFSRCSSLSLALQSSAASPLATQSGPSVVGLDSTLAAGTYSYVVSGGRCSFTLTVTAATP